MPQTPLFLIVDDDNPSDQAAQLRQSLEVAHLAGTVDFASSPAEMLERLREQTPALILLDHYWRETNIERILDEIRRVGPESRVVLYTGKRIDPSTVIDCARWGVAEYLMKGSLSGDFLAKKLSILALSPDNTVSRLSMPSGAVQQLIQEAEKTVRELETERAARRQLEDENSSLKRADRREIFAQVVRFVFGVLYLALVAVLVWFATSLGGGGLIVGFCLVAAFGGLFVLDRSISNFVFKVGKSQIGITRRGGK